MRANTFVSNVCSFDAMVCLCAKFTVLFGATLVAPAVCLCYVVGTHDFWFRLCVVVCMLRLFLVQVVLSIDRKPSESFNAT